MDQLVQSMLFINLGLTAFITVGVSQNVMSEISQIVNGVIRSGIRVSTTRNQKKVISLSSTKMGSKTAISRRANLAKTNKTTKRPWNELCRI
eukprot:1209231-Amphidinium_carterae.1